MSTIELTTYISLEQLLDAVAKLPADQLDAFVSRVNALQLARAASKPVDYATERRYKALVLKRQDETLTSEEHHELIAITDVMEEHHAQRFEAMSQLAQLQGKPLSEIEASPVVNASLEPVPPTGHMMLIKALL
ncbi:MAG: STAS/SEC14 domain-containing protein [Myxococcota bacterium]